jgi:hypothetical protein
MSPARRIDLYSQLYANIAKYVPDHGGPDTSELFLLRAVQSNPVSKKSQAQQPIEINRFFLRNSPG